MSMLDTGPNAHTISITCCRTISSIIPVVSDEASAVSPETYIIFQIILVYGIIAILESINESERSCGSAITRLMICRDSTDMTRTKIPNPGTSRAYSRPVKARVRLLEAERKVRHAVRPLVTSFRGLKEIKVCSPAGSPAGTSPSCPPS